VTLSLGKDGALFATATEALASAMIPHNIFIPFLSRALIFLLKRVAANKFSVF
jgi:hypothetical protein